MEKLTWVPLGVSLLTLITAFGVEWVRNRKRTVEYTETATKLITKVFSQYHFFYGDVDIDQLKKFINCLNEENLSGYLPALYEQANNMIKLDGSKKKADTQVKKDFNTFVRKYLSTNLNLCRTLGFRLPSGPGTFDDPIMLCLLLFLFSTGLFSIGGIGLTMLSNPKFNWVPLALEAAFTSILLVGLVVLFSVIITVIVLIVCYFRNKFLSR